MNSLHERSAIYFFKYFSFLENVNFFKIWINQREFKNTYLPILAQYTVHNTLFRQRWRHPDGWMEFMRPLALNARPLDLKERIDWWWWSVGTSTTARTLWQRSVVILRARDHDRVTIEIKCDDSIDGDKIFVQDRRDRSRRKLSRAPWQCLPRTFIFPPTILQISKRLSFT